MWTGGEENRRQSVNREEREVRVLEKEVETK